MEFKILRHNSYKIQKSVTWGHFATPHLDFLPKCNQQMYSDIGRYSVSKRKVMEGKKNCHERI